MGEWVKALEAKARIIHSQLAAARKLAEETGLDPDDVAQPYLDLINDLYRDEWQFAQLADEDRTLTSRSGKATIHSQSRCNWANCLMKPEQRFGMCSLSTWKDPAMTMR